MTGNRAFYIYVLLFALGTAGAQLTPVFIPAWVTMLGAAALAPGLLVPALRPVMVCLAGIAWTLLRADLILAAQWPADLEGKDVTITGTVHGPPRDGERYLKFDLDVERARRNGRGAGFRGRVRLRWYDPPPSARTRLETGSTWRLTVRVKQPHGHYNPGGFDYEAYLFREHIRATGYVRDGGANTLLAAPDGAALGTARQWLRERLEVAMGDADHPGLLEALALGDRSRISDTEWATLRATGTNHLIAISGLHIGFAAGIGALLGLWIGRLGALLFPAAAAPRLAALGGLAAAGAYAALSGFHVPAQRAFVMAAVFLLGMFFRRHPWNGRGLFVALAAVLILDPFSTLDPGFWLSFCAVALILCWLAGRGERGTGGRVLEAVKLQCMLSLALLPLVAVFFGSVSTVSAPANLLAVPVVMFGVVPSCLLATASAALGWPAAAAASLTAGERVLDLLWPVLSWLGHLSFSTLEVHPDTWQAACLLAGAFWIVLAGPGKRAWGLAAVLVLLAPGPDAPRDGEFRLVVLDVGQGLSAVVQTRHRTLVYDTGPKYPGGFSLASAVVIPYLRARSVDDIDTLIVSHGDNDHRGGFEDLRARFPAARILSSVAGELPGARYCVRGQHWQWDGVEFEILHPRSSHPPRHNNSSCVLRVAGRYGSALLTADIEAPAEESLLTEQGTALRSDVLLVPHQGSATSSTPSFIDAVDPRWAVVSAGYLNRYGHPRPKVMARYRARGIRTINTAFAGAIIMRFTRTGLSVRGWREMRPRYWLQRSGPGHIHGTI